jgi:hypothetical protein
MAWGTHRVLKEPEEKEADMRLSRWVYHKKKEMEQKETTAVLMALDSGSGDLAQRVRMQRRSSGV